MDSGVDTSHQELNGYNKLLSESYLVWDRSPNTDERHGSHVAGIALRREMVQGYMALHLILNFSSFP